MSIFLSPTDLRLNEKSVDVCPCNISSEEIQQTIDTMFEVAFSESKDRRKSILVGLAAPQIGIQQRIILVDLAATGVFTKEIQPPPPQIEVFIDPEIRWKSDETEIWREGCFSTSQICGLVPRHKTILVRAFDRQGNLITQEFSGYTARIFQHEIDHLDGIRFPDRVENDDCLHWVDMADISAYRIEWSNWKRKCPRQAWIEMKNGHIR